MEEPLTKIYVHLEKDSPDWPPFEAESMWARPVGKGRFRIENIPLFAPDLAWGDEVAAAPGPDGALELTSVHARSGHSTFWVIPRPGALGVANPEPVRKTFTALGARVETVGTMSLVAVDVPPQANVAAIRATAEAGNREGRWEAVMGYAAPAWEAVPPASA